MVGAKLQLPVIQKLIQNADIPQKVKYHYYASVNECANQGTGITNNKWNLDRRIKIFEIIYSTISITFQWKILPTSARWASNLWSAWSNPGRMRNKEKNNKSYFLYREKCLPSSNKEIYESFEQVVRIIYLSIRLNWKEWR